MLKIYKHTQSTHFHPDLKHRHAGFAKRQTRDELKAKKQLDPIAIKVLPYGNELCLNKQHFSSNFFAQSAC